MEKRNIKKDLIFFILIISFLTFLLFWQVFIQNKIPLNSNLLASFFNPWAQEKFMNWEHGIPNKPVGKDDLWIFFPQKTFTINTLKNGEIPFWNPYSFSGNYHVGLSETAVFYPLNFLFLIFPQIDLWVFLIIIQPIIAGFGMYLFLKKIMIKEKSSILGAVAFSFAGIVIVRSIEGLSVGHTLIWMPYVFFGIESFFQKKDIRSLITILLSLSMSLLSGWFQFTAYIFVLAFLYSIFKLFISPKKDLGFNLLIIIPFLFLPFVTLFHLLPTVQTLLDSPRAALEGRLFSYQHLVSPFHIFTLFIPDLWGNPAVYNYFGKGDYKDSIVFVGIIPFLFTTISIFKKKCKEELFFLVAIIVSFFLAISNPLSKLIITLPIPIFSSFLPNRIFLITTFSFCVLAAYGLDYVLKMKKEIVFIQIRKIFLIFGIIMSIYTITVTFPVLKNPSILRNVDQSGINLSREAISFKNSLIPLFLSIISIIIFFVFKNSYSSQLFFAAILIVLYIQSYSFAQKYIPFSNREFVYPQHPVISYLQNHQNLDRFISVGSGHILPSIPLQFSLYSPEGIGSMYIRRYGEFVKFMQKGKYDIPAKIAIDLELDPKNVFLSSNSRLQRFFELSSIKYISVDKKSMANIKTNLDTKSFNLVWENNTWEIYQYKKSMPRFFVTSMYKVIIDKEEILDNLYDNSFNPDKIVLEENPGFKSTKYKGNVNVIEYSPNRISLDISTKQPALLYFSDTYSNSFKVKIDGLDSKLLRANYTFRAVSVTKGTHIITIEYNTDLIKKGALISFFAVILFLGIILFAKKVAKK